MRRKSNHILALQCSDHHISALRVRSGSAGVSVVDHIVANGDWHQEDGSLQRKLTELADTHQFSDNRVISILPRNQATVRVLDLPSTDLDEVRGMVELSAVEWVPFSADEIVVSSCIVKSLDARHSQVLAAVVPRTTIDEHMQMLAGAGIDPEHVYLSTACLLAALEFPVPHGENAIYFHRSGRAIEALALHDSGIAFTRSSMSDDSSAEALAGNIEDNIGLYRRESDGQPTGHIHLSESAGASEVLWDSIAGALTASVQNCPQGLRSVQRGVEQLSDVPLPELGAVLIAQGDASFAVDVLPQSVSEQRQRGDLKRVAVQYALVAAMALLLVLGVFGQAVQQRTAYLDTLEEQAVLLRPDAAQVALKRKQLQKMQAQVTRVVTPLEHLSRITLQAPDTGLRFSKFSYRYDEGITLHGRATTASAFSGLIDRLRTVGRSVYPQLVQAREIYRNDRKERGQTITEYAISIEFPDETVEDTP